MKNLIKILSLMLAVVMVLGMVACGGNGDDPKDTTSGSNKTYTDPYASIEDYDEKSKALYDDILGEFYAAYEAAKAETSVSKKWALMAIAEAKLLETGVMLPLTSQGGNYAMSRVAPYTATSALWGNDSYRYHNVLVADKLITTAHRDAMKAKWAELRGTGTYEAWAKSFLVENGYSIKNTYSLGYSTDPQIWDVLATSQAADSEAIVNTYDGLYEYDSENRLMPALATGYTVSEDGLTYTFTIRQGVKWVDSQGREVADVKADDFVAGMQHMMDAAEGLEYLVQGIIVNATEYIEGEITDFSKVGVKAVDDYTLVYTLEQPTSFFMTMLGYGVFAPMSRTYYIGQGGKFGAEYDSTAESYTYGKTPDNIAYCGPYRVTSFTPENTVEFSLNESYWNKDNVNINKITWKYNDGKNALKAYDDATAGVIDGAGLNASALEKAKTDGVFSTHVYVSSTDATSYMSFVNINRGAYANANDGALATTLTEDEQVRSKAALRNQHFRLAIAFALDRGAYNAQAVGEELKYASLINSYTPGNFVSLEEDVTVSINGTNKTYAKGTYYGKIMQDQLDADGVKIKVWDPTAEAGVGSSAGYDGWYNAANAVEQLNLAIAELAEQGIEISAEKPLKIELPYFAGSEYYTNKANAYKQSVEASLGGKVIISLCAGETQQDWLYAGYWTSGGAEANYDLYDLSGWGPDYGDPQTYLDTFLPEYAGYMLKCIGIY